MFDYLTWKSQLPKFGDCSLALKLVPTFPRLQTSLHILINCPSSQTSPTCIDFPRIILFHLCKQHEPTKRNDKLLIILAQISCDATWLRRSTSKDKSRRLAPAFNRKGYRPQGKKTQRPVSCFFLGNNKTHGNKTSWSFRLHPWLQSLKCWTFLVGGWTNPFEKYAR